MCKSNKTYIQKSGKRWRRIDYEQLIMDYFDCIFYGNFIVDWTDDLAYLISMFSLGS